MKAQIRLLPDWSDVPAAALPWAEYEMPIGNAFVPTVTGDPVWVEFPYLDNHGQPDLRRPLITGAAQNAPGGVPNVAPEASGQGAGWTPEAVDGAPARPVLSSSEDYVIHRNNILEIRSKGGGYEIANTAAGSRIGMNEAGQVYIIGPAELVINTGADVKVNAAGKVEIIAAKSIEMETKGGISLKSQGVFSVKAADFDFNKN